jgi:hypothetical protein
VDEEREEDDDREVRALVLAVCARACKRGRA